MLELVITGFQTGVDQHATRAARTCGIRCAGYMPEGFKTESGPRPDLAGWGAKEHWLDDYRHRTESNLQGANGVLVFDGCASASPGTLLVSNLAIRQGHRGKPIAAMFVRCARTDDGWTIPNVAYREPAYVADWMTANHVTKLFIGGNRESKSPGLGAFVETFLTAVFRLTNPLE